MAALAIPLIASAVTALLPIVPGIVTMVENLFGPGSGPAKLQAATNMLGVAANQLSTAGTIPGPVDVTTLTTLAQTVVQQMIDSGKLPSAAAQKSGVVLASSAPANAVPAIGQRFTFTGTVQAG
jgi:hypothetical protein